MKKSMLLIVAAALLAGCSDVREVRVVSVKTQDEYNAQEKTVGKWSGINYYPHTVFETTDTHERHFIRGDHWGKPGDVFKIDLNRDRF